jgi:hypothetical protein
VKLTKQQELEQLKKVRSHMHCFNTHQHQNKIINNDSYQAVEVAWIQRQMAHLFTQYVTEPQIIHEVQKDQPDIQVYILLGQGSTKIVLICHAARQCSTHSSSHADAILLLKTKNTYIYMS